jgi:hypothetical protein
MMRRRCVPLFLVISLASPVAPALAAGPRFRSDDPLNKEPPPVNVENALSRKLSDYYDFLLHTLATPGERNGNGRTIRAQDVNTLGEPMDSGWYTKRHYWSPMSIEQLVDGPPGHTPPAMDGPWTVVSVKSEGITPGFTILDSAKRRYFVKFDPLSNPEMATAADVIASKFFYALGYNCADNYIVEFDLSQLQPGENAEIAYKPGKKRRLTRRDLLEILLKAPKTKEGKYRVVASLAVEGKPIGPFRFFGRRKDDPNDLVPHEHRRDLRGMFVFCAWLNHDDSRSVNTLDTVVEENGTKYVRHYLIDFGSTLGSGSVRANSPRQGSEYLFEWGPAVLQVFTLGAAVPRWARTHYRNLPSVGRFEWKQFDPEAWVPEYPNPAFLNRLPDDDFWAAKQVIAFTDEQIRAIVKTGQYSDPEAERYVADCLIARRDKIGKAFVGKVLPLDRFAVRDGTLMFEDLGAKYEHTAAGPLTVKWSRYDNLRDQTTPMPGENGFALPQEIRTAPASSYYAAEIAGAAVARRTVTVYLRTAEGRVETVGIERAW